MSSSSISWLSCYSIQTVYYWYSRCLDCRMFNCLSLLKTSWKTKSKLPSFHFQLQTTHPVRPCFDRLTDSFFRYCYLNCSPNAGKDAPLDNHNPTTPPPNALVMINGEETEIVSTYSWRNFFTSINFVKILQKMTKHRSHRTCMLNQYKSSVCLSLSLSLEST